MLDRIWQCIEVAKKKRTSIRSYQTTHDQPIKHERLLKQLIIRLEALEADRASEKISIITASDDDSEYLNALEEFGLCD